MVTPVAKRQAVAHLVEAHKMSERRACRVLGCCRMTMRYEVVRQDDPVLRERLKELAKARRRFGYRRLHVFLRRECQDFCVRLIGSMLPERSKDDDNIERTAGRVAEGLQAA